MSEEVDRGDIPLRAVEIVTAVHRRIERGRRKSSQIQGYYDRG